MGKKYIKTILLIPLLICFSFGTIVPNCTHAEADKTSKKVFRWKMQNYGEPGAWYYKEWLGFVELVKRMSNGRLIIDVYPSGALVPNTEMLQAVASGTLDMANTCPIYHTGLVPVANLEYGFPGQYRGLDDQAVLARNAGFLDLLREAYAEKGVYLLNIGSDAGLALWLRKPISKLEDLRKLKIRAGGGLAKVLKRLGAAVVYMPGSEIYTALSTGVIDGVCYGGASTAASIGIPEVTKYYIYPELYGGHFCTDLLVNPKKWKSLPDDLKAILEAASWTYFDVTGRRSMYEDAKVREDFVKRGGKLISLTKKDMDKITKISLEEMDKLAAKDPYCARAVKLMKQYMKRMGYYPQ